METISVERRICDAEHLFFQYGSTRKRQENICPSRPDGVNCPAFCVDQLDHRESYRNCQWLDQAVGRHKRNKNGTPGSVWNKNECLACKLLAYDAM